MATDNLGKNVSFKIYGSGGTSFHDLVLKKPTVESSVMSLGDKISGDVYYKDNNLDVTMLEYIVYDGVRYSLVNPPTIVREGTVSDNGDLKGMTKYSFTFYHPMYMLANFPFADVAVQRNEVRYLSDSKKFAWIGYLPDFVAKINKNLEGTHWICTIGRNVSEADLTTLSEVLSFDNATIADALKTGYETWKVPYIVDRVTEGEDGYSEGKRFNIQFGLPATEIVGGDGSPFVFRFGRGVGLKNNSRNPRNNKIVTRLAGYGSEDNIPYGYPQIVWNGDEDDPRLRYPLYDGIVGGEYVKLIKHPFTRTHLMPSVYIETLNKKVNPNAAGYNPDIELVDYYDADDTYDNPIRTDEPSYEIHEFEKIKPELDATHDTTSIVDAEAIAVEGEKLDYTTLVKFKENILSLSTSTDIALERAALLGLYNIIGETTGYNDDGSDESYEYKCGVVVDGDVAYVTFKSTNNNFTATVLRGDSLKPSWIDTMDDNGNYVQSYFKMTLPQLDFDVYACAAITQEMKINMRGGACIGCTFPVMVDWEDYKANFYTLDGKFAPKGEQRDYEKYPDSSQGEITVVVKKEFDTFGVLMPNTFQYPSGGDTFVILGISLPKEYVTDAEQRLDAVMKKYLRENNVYYYDYPLKFDEYFLATHTDVLAQMKNNVIVRFDYAGEEKALYIKQMSVKFGDKPLPQYTITLTDDVEVVLNQIGKVADEVSNLRILVGGTGGLGGSQESDNARYLRKDTDDTAYGTIRMIRGLQVGERFVPGLFGEGAIFRRDADGTTYLECDKMYVRMRAYFDTVEVRSYIHSGGNRVASKAGITCSRVEYIDADGNVATNVDDAAVFRCYFKAADNDKTITNDFVIGDLAFCHETNVDVSSVDMHGYWRAVVGRNANDDITDGGEAWIDLANTGKVTIDGNEYDGFQSGSDVPIAQDDIVQLGNVNDTTRQGAIIEYVSGDDAPSYQIYQGVDTFSLVGRNYINLGYSSETGRAYMNVYGDMFVGDKGESTYIRYNSAQKKMEIKAEVSIQSTFGGKSLKEFVESYSSNWTEEDIESLITGETDPLFEDIQKSIETIQKQVDGSIETWYYTGVPTLQTPPASDWLTEEDKDNHIGDLYYDKDTGYAYRFMYDDETRSYLWYHITDQGITEALANAAKAQDTADGKRRVFVRQPLDSESYDVGDLWVNATYPSGNTTTDDARHLYYNDILRCIESKAAGAAFSIEHWMLSSKYTDDSALNAFKLNTYVQQLIGGTISDNISAAFQAAQDASTAASNAQNTANNAANSAATANTRLNDWANDNYISPTEKTALENEKSDVEREYQQIVADAARYGVDTSVFYTAYGNAIAAFNKYTSTAVENIEIDSDYANIAGYYAARQTILNAIATAAKKVSDDAKKRADEAWTIANTTKGDLTTYQEAMSYITAALGRDTDIVGGLILSTLIGLRDKNGDVWSGINGAYNESLTSGGIAAWFGGGMTDYERLTSARISEGWDKERWARSLFRFDGSGYLANGNITWTSDGTLTIKDIYTINDGTLTKRDINESLNSITTLSNIFHTETRSVDGVTTVFVDPQIAFNHLDISHRAGYVITDTSVLSFAEIKTRFVSIEFFNRLFQAFNGEVAVSPNDLTTTIDNIKATVGLWTDEYLSALGKNPSSGGGGGGIDMSVVWDALADGTTEQINASHLSTALSGYALTSQIPTTLPNYYNLYWKYAARGTSFTEEDADGTYDGGVSSRFFTIPEKTSQLTNDAGFLTNVDMSGYATTAQLSGYLPLSGGRLTGTSPSNGSPILSIVDNSNRSSYQHAMTALFPNAPSNTYISYCVGVNNSAYNIGYFSFNYIGKDSTSNYVSFGLHSVDNKFVLNGAGNVGIGTITPEAKLHVNGGILATSFIKSGGTSSQFLKADGSVDDGSYCAVAHDGVMEIGRYLDFHLQPRGSEDFSVRLDAGRTTGRTFTFPSASGELGTSVSLSGYFPRIDTYTPGITAIASGNDLNDILTAGTYTCAAGSVAVNVLNTPYKHGNFRLWHVVNTGLDADGQQWSSQILLAPNEGQIFIRAHTSNGFFEWKRLATTTDLSSYLPLSGGTMNENVFIRFAPNIEIKNYGSRFVVGTYNQASAAGVSLGSLLVSNLHEDSPKVPTNGIYCKGACVIDSTLDISSSYKFIVGANMPETSANINSLNAANRMTFYRNAIMIPNPGTRNDGGFFRVRGTSESDTILELGTWDDNGAGETIEFNYYPTTSTVNPTYSVAVPKKSGTIALLQDRNLLVTLGVQNAQTGRTQAYVGGYTYNMTVNSTGQPDGLCYSVIGFGNGTGGSAEIAVQWTNGGNVWWRALRDVADNWYGWVKFVDSRNIGSFNAGSATVLKTARTIWGQSFNGSANVSGALSGVTNITMSGTLYFSSSNYTSSIYQSGGDIVISPYDDVTISSSYIRTSADVIIGNVIYDPTYTLDVRGVIYSSIGVRSAGYVTALSDIREKDVKGELVLTNAEVALAPMIRFLWKDRREDGLRAGSIAQYWERVLPEAVTPDKNGILSMDYGVIALLSAIATARKVEDHERRICELEKECERLRNENEQMRLDFKES